MGRKRILIIDDEPSLTRLLKLNLEQTGAYEVHEENQGRRGLAAAREFKPDLILLDVIMPDLGGGEVADRIMADEQTKDTPIVFLTALAQKQDVEARGGIIGRYSFIAKPVNVEGVIAAIERTLKK